MLFEELLAARDGSYRGGLVVTAKTTMAAKQEVSIAAVASVTSESMFPLFSRLASVTLSYC